MITRTLPQKQTSEQNNPLTRRIIACAIEVHKQLGPGLLEDLYTASMVIEYETYQQKGWLAHELQFQNGQGWH